MQRVAVLLAEPHHRPQRRVAHRLMESPFTENELDKRGDVARVDVLCLEQVRKQRRVGAVDVATRAATEDNELLLRVQHVALADALPQAHEECMHHLVPAGDLALLLLEAVA